MTDVKITVGQAEVTGRFRRVRIGQPAASAPRQNECVVDMQIIVEGCAEDMERDLTKLKQAVSGE